MAYLHFARVAPVEAFPFDIIPAGALDVGPGTRYPVGVSRDQLFKLYWRFKRGQYTMVYTNFSGVSTDHIHTPKIMEPGGFLEPLDEGYLPCNRWSITDGTINIFDSYGVSPDKCRIVDGLYYPAVSIVATEEESPFRDVYSSYADPGNGLIGSLTLAGIIFPLYNGIAGGIPGLTLSGFTTDWEEYWPYDPGNGEGPMCSTATGELLFGKDPFLVQL